MTEQENKEKFKQAIDHTLSGLQGDPFLYQRVAANAEKGAKTVKNHFPKGLVIALIVILCMSTAALAATVLNYSPTASALKQARQAVMDKYGLTHTTLGLFTYDISMTDGAVVIVFRSDVLDESGQEVAGCYTVTVPDDGDPVAVWTYDHIDPAVWQSGDMNSNVWGQPQLESFLRDKTEGGTVIYSVIQDDGFASGVTPSPAPVMEAELVEIVIAEVSPGPDDLSETAVRELASVALADSFGLAEDELARMDVFHCELKQVEGYATRLWHINAYLQRDGYDWNMYVVIDAATGEIVDIGMQTGGNG